MAMVDLNDPFGKTIAVLSSGPSLNQHWKDAYFDTHDTVIAVNFSAFLFRHHWFGFWENWLLDATLESHTHNRSVKRMEPSVGYIIPKPHETDKPCLMIPMLVGASSYTTPNVLKHTLKLAKQDAQIDVYGLDLNGGVDCLGRGGANRDPKRWTAERGYLDPLITDKRVTVIGGIGNKI